MKVYAAFLVSFCHSEITQAVTLNTVVKISINFFNNCPVVLPVYLFTVKCESYESVEIAA